jgi:Kef-type K+ transport system membrane component KefB
MSFNHFLLWFTLILVAGKLGAEASERLKLPAVLGELVAGIVIGVGGIGALAHHFPIAYPLQIDPSNQVLNVFGELGAVLLLFEAGLESDLKDLRRLGLPATWMASAGVIFSFVLCYVLCRAWGMTQLTSVFLGGALASTSVGISARSFSDLKAGHTSEARTVLGAAVADDVIGLVILGVITGIVAAGAVSIKAVGLTALAAILFLVASLPLGLYLAPRILKWGNRMKSRAALSTTGLVLCLILSIISGKAAGLSPIIGAFIAGLILSEMEHKEHMLQRLKPLADVLIPVFFVLMGAAMPITSVSPATASGRAALAMALVLSLVAIVAKIAGGLSIPYSKLNRLVVGIGMVPRGEVALIFAAYGLKSKVIDGGTYSAILIVVLLTTFITPALLKLALGSTKQGLMTNSSDQKQESEPLPASSDEPIASI